MRDRLRHIVIISVCDVKNKDIASQLFIFALIISVQAYYICAVEQNYAFVAVFVSLVIMAVRHAASLETCYRSFKTLSSMSYVIALLTLLAIEGFVYLQLHPSLVLNCWL